MGLLIVFRYGVYERAASDMLIEDFFRCEISAFDETISDFNHLIIILDWFLADVAVNLAHWYHLAFFLDNFSPSRYI